MRQVPNTKAGRLEVQQADFKRLLDAGYTQEVYKGLNIFTLDAERHFSLKVYRDAAAHPIARFYYHSAEQRTKAIADYKKSYDRRQAYKEEAKNDKTKSTAANCAAAIREELKTVFPGIKFSVTSENFAGGDAVRVGWNDGPTNAEVEAITGKYQYGHYDGMNDIYESSNRRDDIPQTKYLTESRHMSPETRAGFKKGTMHFEFLDEKVWGLFNQRVAKLKGYPLPEQKEQTKWQKKQTGYQEPKPAATKAPQKPVILKTIKINKAA